MAIDLMVLEHGENDYSDANLRKSITLEDIDGILDKWGFVVMHKEDNGMWVIGDLWDHEERRRGH